MSRLGYVVIALGSFQFSNPVLAQGRESRQQSPVRGLTGAGSPSLLGRAHLRARAAESSASNDGAAAGGTTEFESRSIDLLSWLPINQLDSGSIQANDCWGYTAPSGREYAIIGLYRGTAFVEITDPTNPRVVGRILGASSDWRDIKVYGHYAYAVSEGNSVEGGRGIQVIDLEQIDQNVLALVTEITSGGTTSTHNVAIDEDSGYLYRCGGDSNGLRIYDLSDPAEPDFVKLWNNRYVHDAQVVTYTEGPYAGRQVAFCCSNDTSSGINPGLDVLDVTVKSNIVTLGTINLAWPPIFSHPAKFSHQGWLSPDRRYFYLGDEADEFDHASSPPTTTRIIDVSDLADPTQVGVFTNNNTSRDHNLYTLNEFIFEANYTSGLRVYDASDPRAPVEIAFFDTYPLHDIAIYRGLWSVYPYFPSGTIIGSDMDRGLFVWGLRECRVIDESVSDCNGNGFSDDCDVVDRVSADCNTNGVPDECDTDPSFKASSPMLGPLYFESPQTYVIDSPPEAASDVLFSFRAFGDLGTSTERVEVFLNGEEIAVRSAALFVTGAGDCSVPPDTADVILSAEAFNSIVNGGAAVIEMEPGSAVSPGGDCGDQSFITVTVEYDAAGTAGDCNANRIPDSCEGPGDLDGDGSAGLADFAIAVDCLTGPCGLPPCDPPIFGDSCCALADYDGDGDFDLRDFSSMQRGMSAP